MIIFCLPPHTTADSQPLDTSVFGPLKSYWSQACHDYIFSNPGHVVTKSQFLSLFRQAWSKGMSIDNICAGFKKTGVYPFDPEAILKNCSESMSTGDDEDFPEDESSSSSSEDQSVQDQFIPEQQKLFEERFQNDYVYTDNDYVAWLQEFHPDSVPSIEAMLGLQCDDNSDSNPSMLTTSSPTQSTLCPPKLIFWNVIYNHKVVTASDVYARSSWVV